MITFKTFFQLINSDGDFRFDLACHDQREACRIFCEINANEGNKNVNQMQNPHPSFLIFVIMQLSVPSNNKIMIYNTKTVAKCILLEKYKWRASLI